MLLCYKYVMRLYIYRKYSSFGYLIKDIIRQKPLGADLTVQGWVQSIRKHKHLYFVDVNDNSSVNTLQVIIERNSNTIAPEYGSSISVSGKLIKSTHKGQDVELQCSSWKTIGMCSEDYPFFNRIIHPAEYIRAFPHLRLRTRTFNALQEIKHCVHDALHKICKDNGFRYFDAPILTTNDCEGAGEVFHVQTNDSNHVKQEKYNEETTLKHESNTSDSEDEDPLLIETEKKHPFDSKEYFGIPVYLTVSAQLHLEAAACAYPRVYTFGKTFRAENARTRRHANEFLMFEAEIAFVDDLDVITKFVEQIIKYLAKCILNECESSLNVICEKFCKDHKKYLQKVASEPFIYMDYAEAVNILQSNETLLSLPIKHGDDFAFEHVKFLTKYCDMPVFITMFPSAIKAYYMKNNTAGQAYCFDLLAPVGGEICGGGLRETSADILEERLKHFKNPEMLSWYVDLRKWGGVPSGGFGIGFERTLQTLLGIPNIRDIIPFPRRKYDCKC